MNTTRHWTFSGLGATELGAGAKKGRRKTAFKVKAEEPAIWR
jgi:hypothetical protein